MHHSSMSWEITLPFSSVETLYDFYKRSPSYSSSSGSHDTEEWWKNWKNNNLSFKKWHEFGEFWSEHSKDSKTCTSIGLFRAKCMTFDLKRKKNWLVVWKMTWEIRQIFNGILLKCQNWYIHGIPLSKVQNAWAKSLQTSYV